MKNYRKTQTTGSGEEGFTLLEVLVAGALGIIVAFAIAQTSINASLAERSSQLDLAYVATMSRIENAIDDPVLCPSLWQSWDGVSALTAPVFVASVFDHTAGPPPVTFIDLIQDGAPTDIAKSRNLGASVTSTWTSGAAATTGLTFPPTTDPVLRMQFREPLQVAENTYNWTLMITTEKLGPTGVPLSGAPTITKRIRVTITTDGSPTYKATYCGPPTSPEANQQIPMVRYTSASPACNAADAAKDTACRTEFGPLYVAAGLQDLVAYRMVFSLQTGNTGSNFRFSVAQNTNSFSNSNDATGTRDGGTVFMVDAGTTCSVACIRNTAPLRFTRTFEASTVASATKLQRCQDEVGGNYQPASPNDLIRYGFRLGSGLVAGVDPNAPGGIFDINGGPNIGCMMGWPVLGVGPILDCGAVALGKSYPVACVLR